MPTAAPGETDALAMVSFNPEDGRIWFNHRRMMMLDTASFATLRDSLIRNLGLAPARALLTQVGYRSGVGDAEMLRRDFPRDFRERSRIGPWFHGVAGIAKVEPVRTDFRADEGYFQGEFLWRHSVEADAHIQMQGLGAEVACWMEAGYATGYLSTVCGQLILVRELECRAMGSPVCRALARPATEWGDIETDLHYLGLQGRGTDPVAAVDRSASPAAALWKASDADGNEREVVGESAALRAATTLMRKVAPTQATVLFTGESGVGKELFARVLHHTSRRADGPFVAINCAAIPDSLIESELFGVTRGGFTGAVQDRPGRFERARGGTLFLDEIGTLSLAAQAKLLRVLQEHEVDRVGGTHAVKVDARIVAATNVNLRDAAARGEFREDLYFRLNVFPIHLPPLRERRDDIPALVSHFLQRFGKLHSKPVDRLTGRAMQAVLNYRFPGNIRELENLIERALILTDDYIDLPHLSIDEQTLDSSFYRFGPDGRLVGGAAGAKTPDALQAQLQVWATGLVDACEAGQRGALSNLEAEVFGAVARLALERSKGNVAAAARLLGLKRHQLEYRLKAWPPAAGAPAPN